MDSLDREDNDILRRILINRLFRTATLLFAALGTMAVNFAINRCRPSSSTDRHRDRMGTRPADWQAGSRSP